MRTTHVGSLVRPDDLVAFLRKRDAGEAYDEQAYLQCLARSVREVVAKQRETGIDIVSDGEYGKSAWNYYVYERLGGIELAAPGPARRLRVGQRLADRLDALPRVLRLLLRQRAGVRGPGGDFACVEKVTYTGGEAIQRDIANLKAAMEEAGVEEGFLPVVAPASSFPNLIDEHYGSEADALWASPRRCARSTRRSSTPASTCRSTTRISRSCTT